MQLETNRLILRSLCEDDWPFFLALHQLPSVMAFVADIEQEPQILARFNERLVPWSKESQSWLTLLIIEKESNKAVGLTGFLSRWHPFQQAEVGFMIHPDAQGAGYGYESLLSVLHFASAGCGYHKITATVTEGNIGSVALLAKAGFELEGRLQDNFRINNQWCSDLVFAYWPT